MNITLLLGMLAAFLTGLSKGGLKGIGVLVVTLAVLAYGAKNSTGILVPLFIIGDILAVIYFKKHVKWPYLIQFLPAMIIGVIVAVFVANDWNEIVFKKWMAGIILFSVGYMFWSEYRTVKISSKDWKISSFIGFAAGFTTMIGNLAGPFSNLYFLATKLPKKEIIGTSAWIFFIINIFKIPFHIWFWETINKETLMINLWLAPLVVLGFYSGTKVVHRISETGYRKFLLIVTTIGALLILFR